MRLIGQLDSVQVFLQSGRYFLWFITPDGRAPLVEVDEAQAMAALRHGTGLGPR
jgi:hypothetical protein